MLEVAGVRIRRRIKEPMPIPANAPTKIPRALKAKEKARQLSDSLRLADSYLFGYPSGGIVQKAL